MGQDGFYYLHENRELIYKRDIVDPNSTFIRHIWPIQLSDRASGWRVCLEALALDARKDRVFELALKWNLTKEDSFELLRRVKPSEDMKTGLQIYIKEFLSMKEEDYWREFQEDSEVHMPLIVEEGKITL